MLSEDDYLARAGHELRLLVDALDGEFADELDAELESDILTIEFADGTRYVVNSHRAARQIWMAAVATPPDAPVINTLVPFRTRPFVTSARQAVR